MKKIQQEEVDTDSQQLIQRINTEDDVSKNIINVWFSEHRVCVDLLTHCDAMPEPASNIFGKTSLLYVWPGESAEPIYLFDLSKLTIDLRTLIDKLRQIHFGVIYLLGMSFQAGYISDKILLVDEFGKITQETDGYDWMID